MNDLINFIVLDSVLCPKSRSVCAFISEEKNNKKMKKKNTKHLIKINKQRIKFIQNLHNMFANPFAGGVWKIYSAFAPQNKIEGGRPIRAIPVKRTINYFVIKNNNANKKTIDLAR